ncbi:MAG: VanZ family protein [Flavobacteriales bacterium]|nr:VanZ family protein [Flavobacteriales bacterium]
MFLKYNYLGVAWAVMILVLCGLPGDQYDGSKVQNADLAIHALLFGVLSFLLTEGFLKQSSYRKLRFQTMRKVFVLTVLYGVVIELLQGTVFIDRSIETMDIVFNTIGSLTGLTVFGAVYGVKGYL